MANVSLHPFSGNDVPAGSRTIGSISDVFEDQATQMKGELDAALAKIQADGSDPKALADYQAKLSDYTLFRNAQSNTTKAVKDIDSATISNFR